jgi:hypothetical protein
VSNVGAFIAVVVLVAVVAGAVGLAMFLRKSNARSLGGGGTGRVDSFAIGEPWRRYVAAAQSAQRRYRAHVQTLQAGPLKARMAEIGIRVDQGVMECWDIAKRGHQLDAAIRDLNPADLRARLDRSKDQRESASLRAQLGSVDRIRGARDDAVERLRVLQTRLGELVGTAAEIGSSVDPSNTATTAGADPPDALGSAVDDVVTELEALRLAIREVEEPLAGLEAAGDDGAGSGPSR